MERGNIKYYILPEVTSDRILEITQFCTSIIYLTIIEETVRKQKLIRDSFNETKKPNWPVAAAASGVFEGGGPLCHIHGPHILPGWHTVNAHLRHSLDEKLKYKNWQYFIQFWREHHLKSNMVKVSWTSPSISNPGHWASICYTSRTNYIKQIWFRFLVIKWKRCQYCQNQRVLPCSHLNVHVPMDLRHGSLRESRTQVKAITVLGDNMPHNPLVVQCWEGHVCEGGLSRWQVVVSWRDERGYVTMWEGRKFTEKEESRFSS